MALRESFETYFDEAEHRLLVDDYVLVNGTISTPFPERFNLLADNVMPSNALDIRIGDF